LSSTPSPILLTNDDGWDSPGLDALRRAAGELGNCRVVAPAIPHSGCGHRVTTDASIGVTVIGDGVMAVAGTPADCVRLALHQLAPSPRWVLSGINAGGNLGADVHHSGTVAAAREAVLHGLPAVALSQYIARGRSVDWAQAARFAGEILSQLLVLPWEAGTFWNVNFPHPAPGGPEPEVVFCPLDPSPLPLNYRAEGPGFVYAGDYQKRAREVGSDVDVCFSGRIAVTLIRVMGSPGFERSHYQDPRQPVD
jgi:5'-nucleotidase